MKRTAAIVLNYFGAATTQRCIRSLVGQGLTTLILVDNSADEEEGRRLDAAVAAAIGPSADFVLHRIDNEENTGFGRGVNGAISADLDRTGGHDGYLLLNNDAELTPGTLQGLLSAAAENKRRALISPRIQWGDGQVCYYWYQPLLGHVSRRPFPGAFPYLSGCCLLVAAHLAPAGKLFDQDFFMYGEDIELTARTTREGWEIHCANGLLVYHEGSGSAKHGSAFYETQVARGHVLLADKLAATGAQRLLFRAGRYAYLTLRALVRTLRYRSTEPLRGFLAAFSANGEQHQDRPPKVLVISHSSGLYGSERSLLTLVTGLRQRGNYRPCVYIPGHGPLVARLKDAGVPVIVRPSFHWLGRSRTNRLFLGPIRLLLNLLVIPWTLLTVYRERFAVIYTNTLGNPFGPLLAMSARLPHVWHFREYVHEDMDRDFDMPSIAHRLMARATVVICNSHSLKEKWSELLPEIPMRTIYNGFTFSAAPIESGAERYRRCVAGSELARLVIIGGVRPSKGQEDAIRAVARLRERGRRICLDIVGDGEPDHVASLKALARETGVEDAVIWHGFLADPTPILHDAAVALVPSRNEAFGRVAVEALALGIPVVCTAIGGLPEVVNDGQTGYLYMPGDIDALAGQISKLLESQTKYIAFSEAAVADSRSRFSMESYVANVEDVIEMAITNRAPGSA